MIDKTTIKLFLFVLVISLLIGRACYTKIAYDKKIDHYRDSSNADRNNFVTKFHFNLDSFGQTIKIKQDLSKSEIGEKILIYRKESDKYYFAYDIQKILNPKHTTFELSSVNTLIIIDHSEDNVGKYNNGKTAAIKTNTDIYFIEKKNMSLISKVFLEGDAPLLQLQQDARLQKRFQVALPNQK